MNKVIYTLKDGSEVIDTNDIYGDQVRLLKSNNVYQSITYIDNRKYQLFDDFTRLYEIIGLYKNINNVLVLGGGGFSFPKYYISTYPDKKMDVVEINKEVIDIAYEYFYLRDLVDEYDPNKERLNIINDDCINYIVNCNKKYDAIFFDVYNEAIVEDKYTTNEFHNNVLKLLNDSGYYCINFILRKTNYDGFKSMMNYLLTIFKKYSINAVKQVDVNRGNNLFITFTNNDVLLNPEISHINYLYNDIIAIFGKE